jgi:hypothetical protein
VVRRRIKEGVAHEQRDGRGQLRLAFADSQALEGSLMWEYTVLATDVDNPLEAVAQLYRNRADSENGFDELKNQWGLSGFTTQDIARCQTTAKAGALVYSWWSWCCRAAHPGARLEAVTSRPLLLAEVGKASRHGGQTQLCRTPMHAKLKTIKALIVNIRAALAHVKSAAQQMPGLGRWATPVRYVSQRITSTLAEKPALTPLGASG